MLESKFYEELYLLECKYDKLDKPMRELRKSIINGTYEPNDFECKLDEKFMCELDLLALNLQSISIKGLPEFWLTVFKKIDAISKIIEPEDEQILKHLVDLDIELNEKKPYNFKLKFYFSPNDYFNESILTKTYEFKIDYNTDDPFFLKSPKIQSSRGCKITWKKEIDFESVSFFNYFKTNLSSKTSRIEEVELAIDYQIGYAFREKALPKGVLYYIGLVGGEREDENYNDSNDEDQLISNDEEV